MSQIIGFPRIGENRELKRALESFWAGKISQNELEKVAKELRAKHWAEQKELENVCVNDFSFYDNVLDLAYALGAKPARFQHLSGLEGYFAMARGHKDGQACAMTKWFNTNYHFVVPELSSNDTYKVNASAIIDQYKEAKALGYKPKIALVGLFTFVALSHITQGEFAEVFDAVKSAYFTLLDELAKKSVGIYLWKKYRNYDEREILLAFVRRISPKLYDERFPSIDLTQSKIPYSKSHAQVVRDYLELAGQKVDSSTPRYLIMINPFNNACPYSLTKQGFVRLINAVAQIPECIPLVITFDKVHRDFTQALESYFNHNLSHIAAPPPYTKSTYKAHSLSQWR